MTVIKPNIINAFSSTGATMKIIKPQVQESERKEVLKGIERAVNNLAYSLGLSNESYIKLKERN